MTAKILLWMSAALTILVVVFSFRSTLLVIAGALLLLAIGRELSMETAEDDAFRTFRVGACCALSFVALIVRLSGFFVVYGLTILFVGIGALALRDIYLRERKRRTGTKKPA